MDLPFTMARRKRLTVLANEDGRPPEASRKELPDPAPAAVFIAMARAASRSKPPEPYRASS